MRNNYIINKSVQYQYIQNIYILLRLKKTDKAIKNLYL